MFCSKCGNSLPDDAKFCSACGAPVKISQEDSPVQQRPAGIADEVENIQVPKPEPLMEKQHSHSQLSHDAKASGKKSRKGLVIGLSVSGVLIAVLAVHCRTKEEALHIKEKLAKRFEECKLELHPVKTRIVYCKDKDRTKEEELTEFDFLGYTFKAVYIKCRDGVMRNNFIASVSKTAAKGFRDKIKALEIHKRTGCKIDMIAELLNPMIRGWMNYFGKFNPSAMKSTLQCIERRLIKWAMCKYKSFRGRKQRAEKWLSSIRKREPKLFAHWSRIYSYC